MKSNSKAMKTFNEVLPEFLAVVKIQVSDKVYKTYSSQLNRFYCHLSEQNAAKIRIKDISNALVGSFILELATKHHLDRPTCQKYFISLRRLWQFAVKHGYTDNMPFDTVELPKKGKDMACSVISPEDAEILLSEIEKKDPQLYLACLTQYYCFTRPGKELRCLQVKDVDLNHGLIRVPQERAKNGHARQLTMPDDLIDLFRKQRIDTYDGDLFVFGNKKEPSKKPVSVNMLRYRFNKYRDRHNMPESYKFYSFKKTGISVLHKSKLVSTRELMDQTGHLKLSSLEHYIMRLDSGINMTIKKSFPAPY